MDQKYKNQQQLNNKYLKELRQKQTRAEKIMQDILDEIGIRYIFQKGFIGKKFHCIVDFYIPSPRKMCIEVDGGYHFTEEQIKKDKFREYYLTEIRKFKMFRVKNEELFKHRAKSKNTLIKFLKIENGIPKNLIPKK